MAGLLQALSANARGVVLLVFLAFAAVALIQWLMWLAGVGRFARGAQAAVAGRSTIGYYIGTFVGQIITEFRHLLALVVVLLFAATMAAVLALGRGDFEHIKAGVQLVAASLGGLIGSIIGYYFGESAAAKKEAGGGAGSGGAPPPVQSSGPTPTVTSGTITPAAAPPGAGTTP
jgi:hypothetical protein